MAWQLRAEAVGWQGTLNGLIAMNYNFDEPIDRHGTLSVKWDSAQDTGVLPMWVADMDFRAAQPILDAIQRRVAHGVFGYTRVPEEYYKAVIGWFSARHGWDIARESILYLPGVVPALSVAIKALTSPGDGVLVQTPVYNCFFSSIRNNACQVVENQLKRVALQDGFTYEMDYEDLEKRAADPRVHLMLLCNPHNPTGRVWTAQELARVAEICQRHGVVVVSDEIHCELAMPSYKYTPFAPIAERMGVGYLVCNAATKAFNIAGLQLANIVCPDAEMRAKIDRAINVNEVCDVNPLGVVATIAAYTQGAEWLEQLREYLWANYLAFTAYVQEHFPQFPVARLEGTYLAWMDCSSLGIPVAELEHRLRSEAKLWLNAGTMYGAAGEGYVRWNLACPRARMLEGLERFDRWVGTR